jgi:hypothetical protein
MKRLEKDEKEHLEKQTRLIGDEVRSGIFVSSTSFNAKAPNFQEIYSNPNSSYRDVCRKMVGFANEISIRIRDLSNDGPRSHAPCFIDDEYDETK